MSLSPGTGMLGMTRRAAIMTLLLKTLFCRYTYKMVKLCMSACPSRYSIDRNFPAQRLGKFNGFWRCLCPCVCLRLISSSCWALVCLRHAFLVSVQNPQLLHVCHIHAMVHMKAQRSHKMAAYAYAATGVSHHQDLRPLLLHMAVLAKTCTYSSPCVCPGHCI